jgi:hypothetical protein
VQVHVLLQRAQLYIERRPHARREQQSSHLRYHSVFSRARPHEDTNRQYKAGTNANDHHFVQLFKKYLKEGVVTGGAWRRATSAKKRKQYELV